MSSLTAAGLTAVKLGWSLTKLTLSVKVCATEVSTPPKLVPPESCTVIVNVEEPDWLGASV